MFWICQCVCLFSGNISQASSFWGSLAWQVLGRGGACNGVWPPEDRETQGQQSCRYQESEKGGLASVQRTQTWAPCTWLLWGLEVQPQAHGQGQTL